MKKARNSMIKKINKLLRNTPKGESLSTIIFKPLNIVEKKVTIRQAHIKEQILLLEEHKVIIEGQIASYKNESKRCDQYLGNLSNLFV